MESKIEIIKLKHNFIYNYEYYKNKEKIYIPNREQFGDIFNLWFKLKNSYESKVEISTENDNFNIPLKLLLGDIEDWKIFKYLAIIQSKGKNIKYEYYSIGEKYGKGDTTIVNKGCTIIKSLFCVINNSKIPLKKFAVDFETTNSQDEIDEIVKSYFKKLENINIIEREKRDKKVLLLSIQRK